jgi:hypothetical protein
MLWPEAIHGEKWLPQSRQLISLGNDYNGKKHLLFVDDVLAVTFWALHLLLLRIDGRMS